ncbi:MAG: class I SAM-dependent methyltransferase [Candidatus Krumholzibacteriota bacterium]|nr:class I SAM-dependent methyltransferase [Candidatus Krumholzibacteriota bacterium]
MKRYREKTPEHYQQMLSVTQTDLYRQKNAINRYYKKNLLAHLPADRTSPILDLGCGFGLFLDFLRERGFTSVTGVDICQPNVDICKSKGLSVSPGDNLTFLRNNPGRYSCIILNHLIEHYDKEDGLELLEADHRSLTADGTAISVCPNMANPLTAGRGRYADLTHETGYTEESLRFILQLGGFKCFSFRPIDIYCLSKSLLNLAGRAGARLMYLFFGMAFLLNGIKTPTIFSKNMLVAARK